MTSRASSRPSPPRRRDDEREQRLAEPDAPASVSSVPSQNDDSRGLSATAPSTWPEVEGRLEFVEGELLSLPPTTDSQQDVSAEIARLLGNWSVEHPEFIVAGNEAGMLLDGEVRAADIAVWRRADVGPHRGQFRRVPPLLAVELAGEDEGERALLEKAAWYRPRREDGLARVSRSA
ncbi:MAG: Uma2 family endonuclease [Myxococcaceae bacterium]